MGINRAPRVSMTVSAVVLCNVMGNGAQAWGADVTAAAADLARGETKDVTSDGDARLGEVIVTSERRETRLQDTPAAIAVMGGEELQQQHVTTVLDVPGMIPNVQVGTNEAQAQITIRGISFTSLLDGDEPRVAYYVNGVYVPRATDQLGTFFDVDRIEVLRGPQGTLYGRNATGGAFSIITNQPTRDLSGYMNFTGGNYGTVQTDGALSGALSDTLTARIAFQTISHNGYGRNLETGTDINDANKQSVRATFRWQPSDAWDITATADYHQESDHNYAALSFGPTYIPLLAPTLSFSQDITAARDPKNKRNNEGLGITSIYHLSDAIDIKSILGYRHSSTDFHSEGEQSAEPLSYNDLRETDDSASAELQMIGNARQWHWVAGLYYFHDRDVPDQDTAIDAATIFGPPSQQVQGFWQNAVLGTNAGAAYADITYDILPSLSLTAGGRYSVEHKTNYALAATSLTTPYPADNAIHNGFLDYLQPLNEGYPEDQAVTFHSFTPKAGLQYRFTDDLNVWFTYSRGFKSGGYAYYFLQPAYNPEKLTDYEGGVKSTWLDRRLTANLTVFHYDFTNMQQQVVGTERISVCSCSTLLLQRSMAQSWRSWRNLHRNCSWRPRSASWRAVSATT